jgi:hypothetical protein
MSKHPQSPQISKELTRKQLSRAERDARRTRVLLLAVGGALALVVLLIGFGIVRDNLLLPNEPVAVVGNQTILTREFQQRVRLVRSSLRQQADFYQQLGLTDNANQIAQQLFDHVTLGGEVLNQLIDEAVYRQSAAELGITVSPDEVQTTIEEQFNYFRNPPTPAPSPTALADTPAPTLTPSATITATPEPTFTPRPTATPVTAEGFQQLYQQQLGSLGQLGVGEADYRRIVEGQLIAEKAQEVLGSRVVTITDQAQFQYIAANNEVNANTVKSIIESDGFDPVYQQVLSSTFSITSGLAASEVPFAPLTEIGEQFGQPFVDMLAATPISGTFGVISGTGGTVWYVGRLLGHEVRPLDAAALQRAQSQAVQDWLAEKRQALNVQVLTWEDRVPSDP